jgi:hypothetical protein
MCLWGKIGNYKAYFRSSDLNSKDDGELNHRVKYKQTEITIIFIFMLYQKVASVTYAGNSTASVDVFARHV